MLNEYLNKIKAVESDMELNNLVEEAAFSEELTDEEYTTIYEAAIEKMRNW